jgi:hypothetical protein
MAVKSGAMVCRSERERQGGNGLPGLIDGRVIQGFSTGGGISAQFFLAKMTILHQRGSDSCRLIELLGHGRYLP